MQGRTGPGLTNTVPDLANGGPLCVCLDFKDMQLKMYIITLTVEATCSKNSELLPAQGCVGSPFQKA